MAWLFLTALRTAVEKELAWKIEEEKPEMELVNKKDWQLLLARETLQKSLAPKDVWNKKSDPDVLQNPDFNEELVNFFAQEATPQTKGSVGQYPPRPPPPKLCQAQLGYE